MLGTLARFLAAKKIDTSRDNFWADVEGDIEDVNGVLKITRIRVIYHLKISSIKEEEAGQAFKVYLPGCPGAQSVIGCIDILDDMVIQPIQ